MYSKEHFDHLFYQMRETLPKNRVLYILVTIIKLLPLFLFTHSSGYEDPPNFYRTIHSYFKYISLSYFIESSLGSSTILLLLILTLVLNVLCVLGLAYYLHVSMKIQKQHIERGTSTQITFVFRCFCIFLFLKYVLLSQFFNEITFLPLLCNTKQFDINEMSSNNILSDPQGLVLLIDSFCQSQMYVFIVLSALNFIIDICMYFLLISRFFDNNILSDYPWNFYPSSINSFLFWESLAQPQFIIYINYSNDFNHISIGIYVIFLFVLDMLTFFLIKPFRSIKTSILYEIEFHMKALIYISEALMCFFYFVQKEKPNDLILIAILMLEISLSLLLKAFLRRNQARLIRDIIISKPSELTEKSIYVILPFFIEEFYNFSNTSKKFSDKSLDLFLTPAVDHIKCCDDHNCPCKNYLRKIVNNGYTITKMDNSTIENLKRGSDLETDYVLNKFFDVLASNISNMKTTENVNMNTKNINSAEQLRIYQLRIQLISIVKKIVSHKLDVILRKLETAFANQFTKDTKTFIRINIYAVNIQIFNRFYKTQFSSSEYVYNYLKQHGRHYSDKLIQFIYLKFFSIKQYSKYSTEVDKQKKKDLNAIDPKHITTTCNKYLKIEGNLLKIASSYRKLLSYIIEENKLAFSLIEKRIAKIKSHHERLKAFISSSFSNEKISDLSICTKIVLLYKSIHVNLPEKLSNLLIVQPFLKEEASTELLDNKKFYLISNLINGNFYISFLSYELLIMLEYGSNEVLNKDIHDIMPSEIVKAHRGIIISEIKHKNTMPSHTLEVFIQTKRNVCLLLNVVHRLIFNFNGEISVLSYLSLKHPNKDNASCFICISEYDEVITINKDFEEHFILSLSMLKNIPLNISSLILQGMGSKIKAFLKDEANVEFQEQFNYEKYLEALFGEEFQLYKESNEKEYKTKYAQWELIKETNRKVRAFTHFIDMRVKMKRIGPMNLYYIWFNIKKAYTLKALNPFNSNQSTMKMKQTQTDLGKFSDLHRSTHSILNLSNPPSTNQLNSGVSTMLTGNGEEYKEVYDDLLESQSQISSLLAEIKKNDVTLYSHKKHGKVRISFFNRSIQKFSLFLFVLWFVSIIFATFINSIKQSSYLSLFDYFYQQIFSVLLIKNVIILSSNLLTFYSIKNDLFGYSLLEFYPVHIEALIVSSIELETIQVVNYTYQANHYSRLLFNPSVESLVSSSNSTLSLMYLNGYLYNKENVSILKELDLVNQMSSIILNRQLPNSKAIFFTYILFNRITKHQSLEELARMSFTQADTTLYYLMYNILNTIVPYLKTLSNATFLLSSQRQSELITSIITLKCIELLFPVLQIASIFIFIYFSNKKRRKQVETIKSKIEANKLNESILKLIEFEAYCYHFTFASLYYLGDIDLSLNKKEMKSAEKKSNSMMSGKFDMSLINKIKSTTKNMPIVEMSHKNLPYCLTPSMKKRNLKLPSANSFKKSPEGSGSGKDSTVQSAMNTLQSFGDNSDQSGLKRELTHSKFESPKLKSKFTPNLPARDWSKQLGNLCEEDRRNRRSCFVNYSINSNNKANSDKNTLRKDRSPKGNDGKISFENGKDDKEDASLKKKNPFESQMNLVKLVPLNISSSNSISNNTKGNSNKADDKNILKIDFPGSKNESTKGNSSINLPTIDNKVIVISNPLNDQTQTTQSSQQNQTSSNLITNTSTPQASNEALDALNEKYAQMSYTNTVFLSFILGFFLAFGIVFIVSIVFSTIHFSALNNLSVDSNLLVSKVLYFNEMIFKYKIILFTDLNETLDAEINQYAILLNQSNTFLRNNKLSIMRHSSLFEKSIQDENACQALAAAMKQLNSSIDVEAEIDECSNVAGGLNKNGIDQAFVHIFNTLISYNHYLKTKGKLTEEEVFEKLTDDLFVNATIETETTIWKYDNVMGELVLVDIIIVFAKFVMDELFLNMGIIAVYLMFSFGVVVLVIRPLNKTDITLSWFIEKTVSS